MTQLSSNFCRFHEDHSIFREAVLFTTRETGFGTTLIEKDYEQFDLDESFEIINTIAPYVREDVAKDRVVIWQINSNKRSP